MILIKKKHQMIGWREWVSLPGLGIQQIKAKIDTGARTSALHAFSFQLFLENSKQKIRFNIHPMQHNIQQIVSCEAEVIDRRLVTDSGGHEEERYVILTPLVIANQTNLVEIT